MAALAAAAASPSSPSQTVDDFSDPLFHQFSALPVVSLFDHGRWRLVALARVSVFFNLRFNIYQLLWLLTKFCCGLCLRRIIFCISLAILKKWPNDAVARIWWRHYQLLADESDFEMDYVSAWRQKLERSNGSSPSAQDVHLYMDNSYLKAPIPTGPDDAATIQTLQMWYALMQFRMGLGEVLLPKRLIRIDRVQICKVRHRPVGLGSKIESLVLGRSKTSHVAFFRDPEKVKDQVTVTQKLLANPDSEGLEFVRSWNVVAVSAIVLSPFVLSLIFVSVWIGLFVQKGADIQVVVQTAFTVASYIVTAGALLIALIAFIDTQTPKDT